MAITQTNIFHTNLMRRLKRYWILYLLISIPVLVIIIYQYIPMLGVFMAFNKYRLSSGFLGMFTSEFVGLLHFKRLLTTTYFYYVLRNTVLINIYALIFGFPVPIIFAIMLNELKGRYYKKFVQTISYLPYFLSAVIVYGIVLSMLSPSYGLLNMLIKSLGGEAKHFMADPQLFRGMVVTVGIWQSTGWTAIIYIAAITSIDTELYEAAVIDGATKLRQIWHITIPGIASIIILNLIFCIGTLLNSSFEMVFLLYSPIVYSVADVIDTYVYRVGIAQVDFSYAAAAGFFKSFVGLILILIANKIAVKYRQTGVWI